MKVNTSVVVQSATQEHTAVEHGIILSLQIDYAIIFYDFPGRIQFSYITFLKNVSPSLIRVKSEI